MSEWLVYPSVSYECWVEKMVFWMLGRKSFSSADNLIQRLNSTHFSLCHDFTRRYLSSKVLPLLYCAWNPWRIICNYMTDAWDGRAENVCIHLCFFYLLKSFAFLELTDLVRYAGSSFCWHTKQVNVCGSAADVTFCTWHTVTLAMGSVLKLLHAPYSASSHQDIFRHRQLLDMNS